MCSYTTPPDSRSSQGYQRAGLVTPEELSKIKKVDRQPKAKTDSLLLSDGPAYALLYLGLLKKLQRVDTMQCILVWIVDALAGESIIHRSRHSLINWYRSRRANTAVHARRRDGSRSALRAIAQASLLYLPALTAQ